MRNWRDRTPRRFVNRFDNLTSSYDNQPLRSPNSSSSGDGVPSWEKQFCSNVGVSWQKVVEAKQFTSGHDHIYIWDDMASEEAFQNAKQRFWAKINGRPFDISLPDPDMHIDEINWNQGIDPELIDDLRKTAVVDDEMDVKSGRQIKRLRRLLSINHNNPWEYNNNMQRGVSVEHETQGWGKWDTHLSPASNRKSDNDPWDSVSQPNFKGNMFGDYRKSTWECNGHVPDVATGDIIQGQNDWDAHVKPANDHMIDNYCWKCDVSEKNKAVEGETWGHCSKNTWEQNDLQHDVAPEHKMQGWNKWDVDTKPAGDLNRDAECCISQCDDSVKEKANGRKNSWEESYSLQDDVPKNKIQGWDHWETCINIAVDLNNDEDPWEREVSQRDVATKNSTWGDWGSVWGQSQGGCVSQSRDWNVKGNPWEVNAQVVISMKDEAWSSLEDSSWNRNQQGWGTSNNWKSSSHRWSNGNEKSWSWKGWNRYHKDKKSSELRRSSSGWGSLNDTGGREETSYSNTSNQRNKSYQGCYRRTGLLGQRRKQ